MRFAYDDNGTRIKPSYSGQKAKCPLCEGTLIGKCGEIYAWHWQHIHDRDCDPWKEHETEWHRKWKAKFPEDWQEVIIEKGVSNVYQLRDEMNIIYFLDLEASMPKWPWAFKTDEIQKGFF